MKIRVTKEVPHDLAIVANVGKEYEVTAQWGTMVEIEGEAAVRVRLLPGEYEWVTHEA